MLEVGLQYEITRVVEMKDTAASVASGALAVFGTPVMIAMMEEASLNLVQAHLEEGDSTVGIEISVKHLKATNIGVGVKIVSTLTKIDGRFLSFDIKGYEEDGTLIGEGTHQRCIINTKKFLDKLNKR